MAYLYYKAINWDETEDEFDAMIWEQLTNNFWLDIRVPITEDQAAWAALDPTTQTKIGRALASASLLAAYQSERCAPALRSCRRTQQEEAVLNIMTFMESVHTKGYTTIFRGLGEDDNAASFFAWADSDAATQAALTKLDDAIQSPVAPVRQAAFILIETELLYNRLAPVLAVTTLPNVARMLTNILAGSLIFVNYIGYKWRQNLAALPAAEQTAASAAIQALEQALAEWERTWSTALDPHADDDALMLGLHHANSLLDLPLGEVADTPLAALVETTRQRVLTPVAHEQIVDVDATEAMMEEDYDF
ncbi:ribonucleotide-diphosphate reductase subunit beta [Lacticaseibacillus porcinae]|uniref:ribonucleotide-diphosphate reductase subunit beta n=1 Tax=Lacticaseibacillus porcinae TaxID=1123687 RepID=UPI000F77F0C2|nr:ribonucleotide-diphosphate reductase subunit beta [Lacticaseibacillus porcinae]